MFFFLENFVSEYFFLYISVTMSGNKKNLLLLFDRPQEPVFVPKGKNKASFEVPPSFLVILY